MNNSSSNNSSSKRKRRQRTLLSSASSVSSVSSGESDSSFNHKSRQRKANGTNPSNDNSDGNNDNDKKSLFSGFWSDAELEDESNSSNKNSNKQCTYYEGFYLTIGDTIYEIGVGDVVAMRNSMEPDYHEPNSQDPRPSSEYTVDAAETASDFYNQENNPTQPTTAPRLKQSKVGDGLMLARVERIWQETPRDDGNSNAPILFQARWFLKKEDVDSLPLGELTGPISSQVFAKSITEHDLVLSNQSDDNHVTTICDLVQVLYRNPNLDAEMPSHVLPATYLCRYSLRIDNDSRVVVLPYTGENDDWKEMTVSALKKRSIHEDSNHETTQNHGTASPGHLSHHLLTPPQGKKPPDTITASAQKRRRVGDFATEEGIDDGLTMQIQVGPDHQVSVPPFRPNRPPTIVSRNPVRMWKPNMIGQEGMDEYIERAANILTPYLRQHHLTQEEPYAPFPTKRMQELSESLAHQRLPTLSSVSSASSLTTHKVDALREFNMDALLRNLHVSNYNVRAAIAAIQASPMDYLVAWSPHEKARFNTGFRRYSGSLRAIYKGMGNKSLRDVIDYHYRFKIPDQFRKIQERKREQAIRMLECIETKRNLNAPIVISNGILDAADDSREDWTKTGSSSLAVSIEERRVKAKELLLDVEAKLGRHTMVKVFEVFKHANESSIAECKTKLLDIFTGHRDFQSRFLEFMPQQLRL